RNSARSAADLVRRVRSLADEVAADAGIDWAAVHYAVIGSPGVRWLRVRAPAADGPRGPGGALRAATVRAAGTAAVAGAVVRRWFTPQWCAAHPERIRCYENMIAATPAEGYAACCAAIETMDIAAGLTRISAPTLVVAGADDPATPPAHGRRIAAAIPVARLEIIESAAHLANVERPDVLNQLILGHLKENS
ncbi:alpha/beta fold hydrolase, partial [Nocardia brasiliensis]|uniref:alpha/beta fold hydrolase n=1 Tax=Nocardia brasiliensis TaxID=37326 RepID=UPI002453E676